MIRRLENSGKNRDGRIGTVTNVLSWLSSLFKACAPSRILARIEEIGDGASFLSEGVSTADGVCGGAGLICGRRLPPVYSPGAKWVRGGWGKRDAARHPLNGLAERRRSSVVGFVRSKRPAEKAHGVHAVGFGERGVGVWRYSTMRGVLSQAKESAIGASTLVSTSTSIASRGWTFTPPGASIWWAAAFS